MNWKIAILKPVIIGTQKFANTSQHTVLASLESTVHISIQHQKQALNVIVNKLNVLENTVNMLSEMIVILEKKLETMDIETTIFSKQI